MDVNTKKRGWVKNAVIIFLSIMLVLTFFSNTIMNRSLAQVSTEYVSSGSISAKIRGEGMVMSNAPYEVSIKEGRRIQSVLVKVGDRVEVGDVLIRLTEEADTQLQEAEELLEDLKYSYQMFLLNMAERDYTRENREIKKMREEIAELEAERDKLAVTETDISAAKIALNSAQTQLDSASDAAQEAQARLDDFTGSYSPTGGVTQELIDALRNAELALEAARLQYGTNDEIFRTAAARWEYPKANMADSRSASKEYLEALKNIIDSGEFFTYNFGSEEDRNKLFGSSIDADRLEAYALAYTTIRDAKAAHENALSAYEAAAYDSNIGSVKAALEAAKKDADALVTAAQKALDEAQKALDDLEKRKIDYKTADESIDIKRDALEDAIFDLSQNQKDDNKQAQKDQLDIAKKKKELDDQQALVDKLSSGDMIYEIVSDASGVVSSISATAGKITVPEETLMTIDQSDRGYTLSFSVTNEKARKVQIGDHAEVSTSSWWFDGTIEAVLTAISANPSDPKNSKMLNFTITGDVNSGDQLSLSIGERSQNYELIVPKSAIRTDSNGSYVLLLEQKPSALGNRYYATRIDVEVIASDDKQCAISGAISSWDYVITSTSLPVEPGDMVRLTEN